MASGRKDYWIGVSPEQVIMGSEQTPILLSGSNAIDPGEAEAIIFYDVPAGYVFYVTQAMIACIQPGINFCTLDLGGTYDIDVVFDTFLAFPFSANASLYVASEKTALISAQNNDSVAITFYGVLGGFIQPLTI